MKNALTLLALLTAWIPLEASAQCEAWGRIERAPSLEDEQIDESSGLASSRTNPGRLWTHNDSGDSARLFLIDEEGATRATVMLDGVDARDWEDMAVGPCAGGADESKSCVYVADIGDNLAVLDSVVIHRFPEPTIGETTTTYVVDSVETLRFAYPDGARDAEALLVHPSGRIFVVDKVSGGTVQIYEVPATFGQAEPLAATKVVTLELTETVEQANLITAGDFSPSGDAAVLKTYFFFYTFCGPADDPVATLSAQPKMQNAPLTLQGESLAWDARRERIWVTSERLPAPMFYLDRVGATEPEPEADAGTPAEDAGTTPPDSGQTNTGDADASPGSGTPKGAEKEGCQAASGQPTSLLFVAFLLLSAVMSRRVRGFATRRTSACGPAS